MALYLKIAKKRNIISYRLRLYVANFCIASIEFFTTIIVAFGYFSYVSFCIGISSNRQILAPYNWRCS